MCTLCCKSKIPPATTVIIMSFIAVVVVICTVSFNMASLFSAKLVENIFADRNLTDAFYYISTEMTMPEWCFLIYIFIFAWQAIWVVFITVVAMVRYKYVPISYFGFMLLYTFNILGSLFIISICHLQLIIALVIMFVNVCLANACFNIVKNSVKSCENKNINFPKFLRYGYSIVVVNGLALYASWTVVQLAMILDANFVFLLHLSLTNSAFITTGVVIAYYIVYFVVDVFIFKHSIQISFMYFSTALYYFSALSYKRGKGTSGTKYGKFLIAVIIICVLLFVMKVVVSLVRSRRANKRKCIQQPAEIKPLFDPCREPFDDYIQFSQRPKQKKPNLQC